MKESLFIVLQTALIFGIILPISLMFWEMLFERKKNDKKLKKLFADIESRQINSKTLTTSETSGLTMTNAFELKVDKEMIN